MSIRDIVLDNPITTANIYDLCAIARLAPSVRERAAVAEINKLMRVMSRRLWQAQVFDRCVTRLDLDREDAESREWCVRSAAWNAALNSELCAIIREIDHTKKSRVGQLPQIHMHIVSFSPAEGEICVDLFIRDRLSDTEITHANAVARRNFHRARRSYGYTATRAPGGGRHPDHNEPTKSGSITLTPTQWAKARRLGDGNASAGVRLALDAAPDPK